MRTTISPLSSAELCRQQGWLPGTMLEGRSFAGGLRSDVTIRIRITAIGERAVLARIHAIGGIVLHNAADEQLFDLHVRDWEKV